MTITTRLATLSDAPAVARLFDNYRQFYQQPPDAAAALRFITQRLARLESQVLVAESTVSADGLVGFCQLYPLFCSIEAQPIFSLSDLFVSPDHRQQGVARRLLLAAAALARTQGRVRMDLTTARSNRAAQHDAGRCQRRP